MASLVDDVEKLSRKELERLALSYMLNERNCEPLPIDFICPDCGFDGNQEERNVCFQCGSKKRKYKHTIQPLRDKVLIERMPEPERLIHLTDADKTRKFRVIAVGPGIWREDENGRWFEPTTVKPGQIVIVPGLAAEQPDLEIGKEILVLENDIGAVVG